jgi:hypothetical protein
MDTGNVDETYPTDQGGTHGAPRPVQSTMPGVSGTASWQPCRGRGPAPDCLPRSRAPPPLRRDGIAVPPAAATAAPSAAQTGGYHQHECGEMGGPSADRTMGYACIYHRRAAMMMSQHSRRASWIAKTRSRRRRRWSGLETGHVQTSIARRCGQAGSGHARPGVTQTRITPGEMCT